MFLKKMKNGFDCIFFYFYHSKKLRWLMQHPLIDDFGIPYTDFCIWELVLNLGIDLLKRSINVRNKFIWLSQGI